VSTATNLNNDARSIRDLIQEIRDEVRDFAMTRIEILKAEIKSKVDRVKTALPMLAVGGVFLIGAFFALTYTLIAAIAVLVGGQWAWVIGGAAVFGLYLIIGGLVAWMGYKEISTEGLAPERTMRTLKEDQQWLQNEARRVA